MPLSLSYKVHPAYLEIVINGQRIAGNELEEIIGIWQKIFALSKRYRRKHILTRNQAEGTFPLNAQVNMALSMDEMGCTKSHRVACLAYSDQLFDEQELVVKYARAQGYSGQLFNKEEEALDWLLQATAGTKTK